MKLAIMQPYFFPYIGYFQLLKVIDKFVVYDDVAFIKQGWINRNRILVNGQATYLTVPVKHASSFRPIREIEVDDGPQNRLWPARLLNSIDNAYRRAPEFAHVFPLVEAVLLSGAVGVADLAVRSLLAVARHLDLHPEWVETSSVYANAELTAQDRVLDICRAEGAAEYVNAQGGAALYSTDDFARAGIRLRFIQADPLEYTQFGAPFVPWLSIIDVLMFNSPTAVRELLNRYHLTP
jgi:hypothetical protein